MTPRPGLIIACSLVASVVVGCSVAAPTEAPPPGWGEPAPAPAVSGQVLPVALRIPSIGVNEREWVEVGQDANRVVEVPDVRTPRVLGLYCPAWKWTLRATPDDPDCGAPVPGEKGAAVVLGHHSGGGKKGVFNRLPEMDIGDLIEVDRTDGQTAVFKVTKVRTMDKNAFPTESVYGDTPKAEIRLVSCTGRLDRAAGRFLDQAIVWGELVALRPTQLTPTG